MKELFNKELSDFVSSSPTSFHAVKNIKAMLLKAGFTELNERDRWNLKAGEKYFVTENDSSIAAFSPAKKTDPLQGLRILEAHTDRPALKLKPDPLYVNGNMLQLAVEVYGGPLLRTWFDRDLTVAGRVSFFDGEKISSVLINFKRPVAVIPSLAVHLNRNANGQTDLSPQKELVPVAGILGPGESAPDFELLLEQQILEETGINCRGRILGHDLFLADAGSVSLCGFTRNFMTGQGFDNLLSCFAIIRAASDVKKNLPFITILNDHEECGSLSWHGADGAFLKKILARLYPSAEDYCRTAALSMILSLDNAHGTHPNYRETMDPSHHIYLNKGPVIKFNASQRYATSSETSAFFKLMALNAGVDVQQFVMNSSLSCGTTIGPVTSAGTGIPASDAGVPTLAMHSFRELAGTDDCFDMYRILLNTLEKKND